MVWPRLAELDQRGLRDSDRRTEAERIVVLGIRMDQPGRGGSERRDFTTSTDRRIREAENVQMLALK